MKTPKECENCKYYKIISDYIRPYNFCKKMNRSFSGGEPVTFFTCGKLKKYQIQAKIGVIL